MKKYLLLGCLLFAILVLGTSCTYHTYHFGVPNQAAMVPDDFGETEAALARAEQSEGAKYCPEKLAKAKDLARQGAEVYWACRNVESSKLLAEARQLAKEVEGCGPQAAPPAPAMPASPACSLGASPTSIQKGQSASLNWSSQNTEKLDLQPGIGPVGPQGSMTVTPQEDTSYTLTCAGAGGTMTSEAKVTIVAPSPAKEELCMELHIKFDTDKSVIKPAYYKEVERVADFMKKYPQVKGTIDGHTDNVGTAKYNVGLSMRRANSVVKMLVDKYGIDSSRLTANGYGETKPIASNKTKEGRQKNRRIEANFGCVSVEK
ncbi:MAG TPA: OmpA family protein [Geobacteraceae bacterium]|nr:OmpA family protein [Geobacteraceae bacterium]